MGSVGAGDEQSGERWVCQCVSIPFLDVAEIENGWGGRKEVADCSIGFYSFESMHKRRKNA